MLVSRIAVLSLPLAAVARPLTQHEARQSSLSSFLQKEDGIAYQGVLNNIGSNIGAAPGVVVASPSTSNPHCEEV